MCGINGIYLFGSNVVDPDTIRKMNTKLSHRGPDADGVWSSRKTYLGHRRLSIIDLSEAGKQPMLSHDKSLVLTFNGEIYNYQKLKSELTDYPFSTRTDSEVILAAYVKWGKDCLNKLEGMFAFAIWDNQKQTLFVARDRMGIKPLYYCANNNGFAFSSEIRALISSGFVEKDISNDVLQDYLLYQTVHAPRTIIKDIWMLMPGHFIEIKNDRYAINKYWEPEKAVRTNSSEAFKKKNDWKKAIKLQLFEAVEKRLVADVRIGAFLSGGIDSSAIVGIISSISKSRISTFNISFSDEKFSEAKYARLIADKFNTDHHEIQLSPRDFLDDLPNALNAMDHPSGDGANTYTVSKATKAAGITVALSGLGGDELFAGYPIFKQLHKIEKLKWINKVPYEIRKSLGLIYGNLSTNISSYKQSEVLNLKTINAESAYPISRQVLANNHVENLLSSGLSVSNSVYNAIADIGSTSEDFVLSRVSLMEMKTYLSNVLLRDTDQMSMAHALEVRVPFLDHKLVELLLQVPDHIKFPNSPKQLLIESLDGLLPDSIVNRPKMGFVLPFEKWMKEDLFSFCESNIKALADRKQINGDYLIFIWKRFLKGDPMLSWSRIWPLVVLEHWLQKNDIPQ